jgi:hypothetical protein
VAKNSMKSLVFHHSRDSPLKQWNETLCLALRSLSKYIKATFTSKISVSDLSITVLGTVKICYRELAEFSFGEEIGAACIDILIGLLSIPDDLHFVIQNAPNSFPLREVVADAILAITFNSCNGNVENCQKLYLNITKILTVENPTALTQKRTLWKLLRANLNLMTMGSSDGYRLESFIIKCIPEVLQILRSMFSADVDYNIYSVLSQLISLNVPFPVVVRNKLVWVNGLPAKFRVDLTELLKQNIVDRQQVHANIVIKIILSRFTNIVFDIPFKMRNFDTKGIYCGSGEEVQYLPSYSNSEYGNIFNNVFACAAPFDRTIAFREIESNDNWTYFPIHRENFNFLYWTFSHLKEKELIVTGGYEDFLLLTTTCIFSPWKVSEIPPFRADETYDFEILYATMQMYFTTIQEIISSSIEVQKYSRLIVGVGFNICSYFIILENSELKNIQPSFSTVAINAVSIFTQFATDVLLNSTFQKYKIR